LIPEEPAGTEPGVAGEEEASGGAEGAAAISLAFVTSNSSADKAPHCFRSLRRDSSSDRFMPQTLAHPGHRTQSGIHRESADPGWIGIRPRAEALLTTGRPTARFGLASDSPTMNDPGPSTLDLLRAYYAAFNEGDREGMLALLADGVLHEINHGPAQAGRDAFRAFLSHMDACYREQVEELVLLAKDDGTRAAAEFFIRGEYTATDEGLPAATGQPYRIRVGAFFEVAGGRITRVTNYYNLRAWLHQISPD